MKRKLKLAILLSACVVAYSQDKPNPNFTGGEVKTIKENSQGNSAHFYFSPGSRTKWHSHEGGQIILVEDGVGLYQEKGGPVVELRAGETHYCPPGVVHWHGASPTVAMTHIAIAEYLDGKVVDWMEKVGDDQYRKL